MPQQAKLKKYVSYPFHGERYQTEIWNAVTTAVCAHYDSRGINPLAVTDDPQLDAIRASCRSAHYQVTRKQPYLADEPMGAGLHRMFQFSYRQSGYWLGRFGQQPHDTCKTSYPLYVLSDNDMYTLYRAYVLLQTFLVWRSGELHNPDVAWNFPRNDTEVFASFEAFRTARASRQDIANVN